MKFNLLALGAIVASLSSKILCSNASSKDEVLALALHKNLPEACKSLHKMGKFNFKESSDYGCMFHEGFDRTSAAQIMVLLLEMNETVLVGELADMWIENRNWDSSTPVPIAEDLERVINLAKDYIKDPKTSEEKTVKEEKETKKSKKSSKDKKSKKDHKEKSKPEALITPSSVYGLLKIFLERGKAEIFGNNSAYHGIIGKIFNLASVVDKDSSKARVETVTFILKTFLAVGKFDAKAEPAGVVKKVLNEISQFTSPINSFARKGKINQKAWETYAPLLCTELTSLCSSKYVMGPSESPKKKSNSSSSSNSDESSEDSSDEEDNNTEVQFIVHADSVPKTLKAPKTTPLKKPIAASKPKKATVKIQGKGPNPLPLTDDDKVVVLTEPAGNEKTLWMVLSLGVVVVSGLGFAGYMIYRKKLQEASI